MSSKNIQTRNRILKSAWKLLEANDGSDVRMVDIAKSAGLSRQAVYLHFPTRSELLIETTKYLDEINGVDARLVASRIATTGADRLDAFIEMWGNYIPKIYGVGKALLAMKDSDEAAMRAWSDRMQAVRHGCHAAVKALKADNQLTSKYSVKQATDILWTMLSVQTWEHYRQECGWSQKQYIRIIKNTAHQILLENNP